MQQGFSARFFLLLSAVVLLSTATVSLAELGVLGTERVGISASLEEELFDDGSESSEDGETLQEGEEEEKQILQSRFSEHLDFLTTSLEKIKARGISPPSSLQEAASEVLELITLIENTEESETFALATQRSGEVEDSLVNEKKKIALLLVDASQRENILTKQLSELAKKIGWRDGVLCGKKKRAVSFDSKGKLQNALTLLCSDVGAGAKLKKQKKEGEAVSIFVDTLVPRLDDAWFTVGILKSRSSLKAFLSKEGFARQVSANARIIETLLESGDEKDLERVEELTQEVSRQYEALRSSVLKQKEQKQIEMLFELGVAQVDVQEALNDFLSEEGDDEALLHDLSAMGPPWGFEGARVVGPKELFE